MNLTRHLLEGAKLAALLGAIALVLWTMPEQPQDTPGAAERKVAATR